MTKHPVELHYENRLEEAAPSAEEADYLALDQSKYGTDLRHAAVLDVVKDLDCDVLDLGCGTGLILEALAARGLKPLRYVGYDGIESRREHVIGRLKKHRIEGEFRVKPMETRFEEISYSLVDAALLVGVMGYYGYHTLVHARSIYAKMERIAQHGAITFPMIWSPTAMGSDYLRRFDIDEVKTALNLSDKNIVQLEREFVIYW